MRFEILFPPRGESWAITSTAFLRNPIQLSPRLRVTFDGKLEFFTVAHTRLFHTRSFFWTDENLVFTWFNPLRILFVSPCPSGNMELWWVTG